MKALMIVSQGLEECEGLVTRDILLRSGIEVTMMSLNNEEEITSSHKLDIKVLPYFNDYQSYDLLILPGGKVGTLNNDNNPKINELLDFFIRNKSVAAICAAPSILGKRGYLKNKKYTCYPGWEKEEYGIYTGEEVVKDGNIITGRSMYFTNDFALKIVESLLGKEKRIEIEKQIKGILY